MKKIILCRGIPASGKSTWAKQWVNEDPENRVRFNNDDVRNMLGKYWVPNREGLVTAIKESFLEHSISSGYDIVIDNTNLNPKEIFYYEQVLKLAHYYGKHEYQLEYKDFFNVSLQECIERNSKRPNPVGELVIRRMYEKYKHIIEK